MSKKLFVPFLVMIFIGVIFLTGCNTAEEISYDITGNWQFTLTDNAGWTDVYVFSFSGTIASGISTDITNGRTGTYSVNNTNVQFTLNWWDSTCSDQTETFTGTFNSTTSMSGSYDYSATGGCFRIGNFTWTAVKL